MIDPANRSVAAAGTAPVLPDPEAPGLTRQVAGTDQDGRAVTLPVVLERPLTLYLNGQEIVTLMTVGAHPRWLAAGYLVNQNMLRPDDEITAIDHDAELEVVVVRTRRQTGYEARLKRRIRTSGCAMGTMFADVMDKFDGAALPAEARIRTSWLAALTRRINTLPSLYLQAGAIHGCVLCHQDRPLVYVEDVGRHNAADMIAGYMRLHGLTGADKILYTTGRLTSEMVIKTVQMGIPVLVSRSGFTAWGVDLALRADLTLIGRARGRRFVALAGGQRIIRDDADSGAPADDAEDSVSPQRGGPRA